MALVGYSDSEGSDSESPSTAHTVAKTTTRAKGAFQKLVDPSAPRKIKVDLPTITPTPAPDAELDTRPAKKPRTAGAFGGFNSFLPAPKRDAAKKPGIGSGVNLKTGAEPAFSRERVDPDPPAPAAAPALAEHEITEKVTSLQDEAPQQEVKPVGNAMRFKPLSVARKKTAPKKKVMPVATPAAHSSTISPKHAPAPKPKVSLFSVSHEDDAPSSLTASTDYQPLLADPTPVAETSESTAFSTAPASAPADPNSLDAIADDLHLSASARRQLFGRNKDAAAMAKISHFNMDAEYAHNEQLRAQGEAVEHRAVKAVAPGKHSLQQLVSAAASQKEALEDAWAQGKRNKAEGGSRYGW